MAQKKLKAGRHVFNLLKQLSQPSPHNLEDTSAMRWQMREYLPLVGKSMRPPPNWTRFPQLAPRMQQRRQQHKLRLESPDAWLWNISSEVTCNGDRNTFIVFIFRCDTADNVANAGCYMNQRSLLAQRKTRCNRKRQSHGFCEQGSHTEIAMDNETCTRQIRLHKLLLPPILPDIMVLISGIPLPAAYVK